MLKPEAKGYANTNLFFPNDLYGGDDDAGKESGEKRIMNSRERDIFHLNEE